MPGAPRRAAASNVTLPNHKSVERNAFQPRPPQTSQGLVTTRRYLKGDRVPRPVKALRGPGRLRGNSAVAAAGSGRRGLGDTRGDVVRNLHRRSRHRALGGDGRRRGGPFPGAAPDTAFGYGGSRNRRRHNFCRPGCERSSSHSTGGSSGVSHRGIGRIRWAQDPVLGAQRLRRVDRAPTATPGSRSDDTPLRRRDDRLDSSRSIPERGSPLIPGCGDGSLQDEGRASRRARCRTQGLPDEE